MSSTTQATLTKSDLKRWKLVADFKKRLAAVWNPRQCPPTWTDEKRWLKASDYLGLFLFGLFNPVVRTMRGLVAASRLDFVQEEVCTRPISLGSFSEAQHLVERELLEKIFMDLTRETGGATPETGIRLIQDSSLFAALPRMHWALWRRQGQTQAQVRLHLSLDLARKSPVRAEITPGKTCERSVWRQQWRQGDSYVGDRYYGENYQLFGEMEKAGVTFVVRLRDEAIIHIEEELPVSEVDRPHKVVRAAWAHLGCQKKYHSIRLRVIWVQTEKEVLRLVTNLKVAELSAADVALLYQQRWQIELFFRWLKCILGCRHWLAESAAGAALQIYLALIAALLLQLYHGERPNRRMMEWLQFYTLGVASLEEVMAGIEREKARLQAKKKKS